jgi:serine/threonine-protein kinase
VADLLEHLRATLAERYRVDRELGRGGMAAVFLAEDLKHRRPVALKVLLPELAAALGPERFLREVETTARLTHPHILPLHDSGAAGGLLYYVMPYAEGESLRDRLRREQQLPLDEAIRIAREVAEALEHAHSRSLIHRDIKPENILLSGGHAVLSDFGIARAVREAGGAKLTESGAVLGTPSYMSPEQATGSDVLDARSDLYSLGCVLYEMLAGQPPFTGPTGESVLHQHLTATPHPVTTIRPSVPAAVAQALQRALAKTPADRFGTVRQFAEALESALRAPPGERPRREGLRRLFLAAAVLALLAAGALLFWKPRPAPEAGRESWILVAEFDAPPDDPELAVAARDLVSVALDQSGMFATVPGDQLRVALQMAGKPPATRVDAALAQELASRSSVRAVLEGRISRLGAGYALALRVVNPEEGRTLLSLSEVAENSEGLVQAIARAARKLREGLGEHRGEIASGRKLAEIATPSFAAFRKFAQARESMRNADFRAGQRAAREALAKDPDFALAWYQLGLALGNLGKRDSAEAAMNEALKRPQRLTDSQLRSIEISLALNRGDMPAAIAALERRLEQDPENAGALLNLGVVLDAAGHQEEALHCFERAAQASPFGPAPVLRLNQFLVLQALGRMDEARDVASQLKGDFRHEAALLLVLREEAWARAESLAVALEEHPTSSGEVRLDAALARASVHAARWVPPTGRSALPRQRARSTIRRVRARCWRS